MAEPDQPSLREQFDADPWPVVGFITTEHSALTSRRGTITSETNGRVGSYLTTLSAALVALGFVGGRDDGIDETFFRFGIVVLLVTATVGVVTFLRCLQSSVEDLVLGERIERIRKLYIELAPGLVDYFAPAAGAGLDAARRASGMGRSGGQLALTLAGLVSVVNSAVLGVTAGFAVRLVSDSTAAAPAVGLVTFVVSLALQIWLQSAAFHRADRSEPPH